MCVTARLASASPNELVALTWYTVKKGESLATIARKLKVSRLDLAEANNLSTKSKVRTGQSLVVPRAPATLLATNSRPSAPTQVASQGITGSAPLAAADDPRPAVATKSTPPRTVASASTSAKTLTYRVKRGDTLFGIAEQFDTTVAKIKTLNHLRSNRITPGYAPEDRSLALSPVCWFLVRPSQILRSRPRAGSAVPASFS